SNVVPNPDGCDLLELIHTQLQLPSISYRTTYSCDPQSYGTDTTYLRNTEGCDSLIVTTTQAYAIDAVIETEEPDCRGEQNGLIRIMNVDGGNGPYRFAIDDRPFQSDPYFLRLQQGAYMVRIEDAEGCQSEQEVAIVEPLGIEVDAGPDQRISFGDSLQINAIIKGDWVDIYWEGGTELSCRDCPAPQVQPMRTTTYTIIVTDANGCTAEDRVTVFVDLEKPVYIPTGFSPNDDGNNDVFIMHSNHTVQEIRVMRIFDRWGNLVYEVNRIQPNEELYGWDGRHRGELLNPGVFVYYFEIEFIDGSVESFKGDVTLIR
ncbi:MAG: gliding motility-associated C-terminal domain-containing protein, partial [Bacteroidota bacterium]